MTFKRKIVHSSFTLLAISVFLFTESTSARAQEREIRVAVAADLKFAMEELAKEFESQTGTRVEVTSGSSGNFFAQIQSGAPFDLFFSADVEYPRSEEHTSELQSRVDLVCRLLLEKKKKKKNYNQEDT